MIEKRAAKSKLDNKLDKLDNKLDKSEDKFKEILNSVSDNTKKAKQKFDEYEPDQKRTMITVLVGAVTLFLALFGLKRHLKKHDKKDE